MSVINRAKLLALVDYDEVFLRKIIGEYLDETSKKIMALNMAFFKRDSKAIQLLADSIRDSSENMTASEMQQAAAQLENAVKLGDYILGAYYIHKIETGLDEIKEAIYS